MSWSSYERVKAALEHREPDKVPFDIGGSVLTGMNVHTYKALRDYLGLEKKAIDIVDPMQQLARVDEDMRRRLLVDVGCVDPDAPSDKGLAKDPVEEGDYWVMYDEWGIQWRMPKVGGHYYDMTDFPLKEINSPKELDSFPWPDAGDPARFTTLKARADDFVYGKQQAYILGRQYAGIWETALWMSGFEKFFMDMMTNEEYAHALMEKITQLKMIYWGKALEAVGENVLIVSEADDLATQQSPLVSPDLYEKMVHPYHKKLFSYIKEKAASKVYIFYHSCGSIKPLIPYLIEEGVDILNPVQVNANDMDTADLKREFGKDVTFWGGGVDTQKVLPFGTRQEVRDEVKKRIDELGPGGGFVFAAVHNVQSDVSPENFMAMWEALQEFGGY